MDKMENLLSSTFFFPFLTILDSRVVLPDTAYSHPQLLASSQPCVHRPQARGIAALQILAAGSRLRPWEIHTWSHFLFGWKADPRRHKKRSSQF